MSALNHICVPLCYLYCIDEQTKHIQEEAMHEQAQEISDPAKQPEAEDQGNFLDGMFLGKKKNVVRLPEYHRD